jgi:hypothetical protein
MRGMWLSLTSKLWQDVSKLINDAFPRELEEGRPVQTPPIVLEPRESLVAHLVPLQLGQFTTLEQTSSMVFSSERVQASEVRQFVSAIEWSTQRRDCLTLTSELGLLNVGRRGVAISWGGWHGEADKGPIVLRFRWPMGPTPPSHTSSMFS